MNRSADNTENGPDTLPFNICPMAEMRARIFLCPEHCYRALIPVCACERLYLQILSEISAYNQRIACNNVTIPATRSCPI